MAAGGRVGKRATRGMDEMDIRDDDCTALSVDDKLRRSPAAEPRIRRSITCDKKSQEALARGDRSGDEASRDN